MDTGDAAGGRNDDGKGSTHENGGHQALRRSTRRRRKPGSDVVPVEAKKNTANDDADSSPEETAGLEQIEPCPHDDAVAPFELLVHPSAAGMIQLHSHFARSEVIGYLAGIVYPQAVGEDIDERPRVTEKSMVHILEAFPAKCISAGALARTGRSAYTEVEMDPESEVEVRCRICDKGLQIVGWYHSHPFFSTNPSEVDIENQRNFQNLLFRGEPYVAAVCAPFWEESPSDQGELSFFYVRDDTLAPMDVKYVIDPVIQQGAPVDMDEDSMLASFENESVNVIATYSRFAKRSDLLSEWRSKMTVAEKLAHTLLAIAEPPRPKVVSPKPHSMSPSACACPGQHTGLDVAAVPLERTKAKGSSIERMEASVPVSIAQDAGPAAEIANSTGSPQHDATVRNGASDATDGVSENPDVQNSSTSTPAKPADVSAMPNVAPAEANVVVPLTKRMKSSSKFGQLFIHVVQLASEAWSAAAEEQAARAAEAAKRKRRRRRKKFS